MKGNTIPSSPGPRRRRWLASAICAGLAVVGLPRAQAQANGQPIQGMPWANDFSYLANPAKRSGAAWEDLSYIPLGDDPKTYLSVGGEIRYAYNYWDHAKLGLAGIDDGNHNLEQRLRLYADLHLGESFRTFVELGDNREFGERVATGPNRDRLDLMEAFFDWKINLSDSGSALTLRPGRFYMPLGSGKLAGVREAPNMRFSYDGVRAFFTSAGGSRLDLFYVNPVLISDEDDFDDKPNHATRFSGAYFTHPLAGLHGGSLDLYFYDVARTKASYTHASGEEDRQTYGSRLWGKRSGWDYDAELALQGGHVGGQDIRAWGVLTEGGFTFAGAPLAPRLGVRINAFSGDDNASDGRLGTFSAPAPRMPLFSDAAWVNYMNLVDAYPQVTFHLPGRTDVTTGLDFMWRQTLDDGIYFGPSAAPLTTGQGAGRYIGTNANLQLDWQANRLLNLHLLYTHLHAGSAVTDAGGVGGNYLLSWVDFRF